MNKMQTLIKTYDYNDNSMNKGGELPLFSAMAFDHVLTGEESVGWALQGSCVTNIYPDAVAKVKELYTNAADVEYRGISCKRSTDGRYIADIAQKEAVDDLFNTTGVADFYVLDEAKDKFYLPKTKWFMQCTGDVDAVNGFNEAGLPNIEGSFSQNGFKMTKDSTAAGAFSKTDISSLRVGLQYLGETPVCRFDFNASDSDSVYGNSDTVQPSSSNKLLYYKVGNTLVNEFAIDVGNILTELGKKVNTDGDNFSVEGKSAVAAFSMPSSKFDELTLGPDNASYIAPANGWFYLNKKSAASNEHIALSNRSCGSMSMNQISTAANQSLYIYVPAKKGDRVVVVYNASGPTTGFRFIYAEGEQ